MDILGRYNEEVAGSVLEKVAPRRERRGFLSLLREWWSREEEFSLRSVVLLLSLTGVCFLLAFLFLLGIKKEHIRVWLQGQPAQAPQQECIEAC